MRGERIPTSVTRSLARNDRSRRRDTRVPPYRVQRFYGADRVVRPYEWQRERADEAAGHTGPALQGAALYGADRVVRPYLLYKEKELPEGGTS